MQVPAGWLISGLVDVDCRHFDVWYVCRHANGNVAAVLPSSSVFVSTGKRFSRDDIYTAAATQVHDEVGRGSAHATVSNWNRMTLESIVGAFKLRT